MLKTTIVAALVALLLTAGSAVGSANWQHEQYGIICKSTTRGSVICLRDDGSGYAVAFNRDFVFVTNSQNRRIFTRYQP